MGGVGTIVSADYYGKTTNQWKHQFRRNASSGVWQYAGNRRWAYTEITPINARFPQSSGSWEYRPYVMSWITTRNTVAAYALLSGPGLANWAPPSLPGFSRPGLVLGRTGSNFRGYSIKGLPESTWVPDCATPYGQHPFEVTCIDLTKVSAGSVYTYTLLDANGVPMGTPETIALTAKPYSAAESAAGADAWFGRISATDPTSLAGLTDGKRISYTVIAPTYSPNSLWRASLGAPSVYLDAPITGVTVDVGVWSGPTPPDAHPTLTVRDASGRRLSTHYDLR